MFVGVLAVIPYFLVTQTDMSGLSDGVAEFKHGERVNELAPKAQAGDAQAQVDLAFFLLGAKGKNRDPEAALRWLMIARRSPSAKGHEEELDQYIKKVESEVAADRIAAIRAEAEAWKPKP